tara:strand:+ start:67 stop:657 length:591 start_codon:yes stop_codon:yes gene_type:complete
MAQQSINLGTSPNDGTGTDLRSGGDIINDNFTELYKTSGWGNYDDGETTPATQTISTAATILLVDGLGGLSESAYLPREIRGVSELWDGVDSITPINIGDSYDVRFTLEVTGKTGSPDVIEVVLDIGGAAGVTIPVAEVQIPVIVSPTFTVTGSIPIFALATFKTNGGRLFLRTNVGTLTISNRAIFIKRDFNGNS